MKPSYLLLLTLGLAACASSPSGPLSLPLQERLRNPLVAERYWSDMAEHMADFTRNNDPIMKDPVKAAVIEDERLRALERVDYARSLKKEGISGIFQAIYPSENAMGEALLRGTTLSFSSTFEILPGPAIRVYLTTAGDPRDVRFPDASALDLGLLQNAFGSQEYAIAQDKLNPSFLIVVLYDKNLNRVVAFAQLEK